MNKAGIYIHIPFCRRKCNYCDFYLVTNLNIVEKFIYSLKKEIELSSDIYKNIEFDTIFFGGGTPSLLSAGQIEDIINSLSNHFQIDSISEVTLESNPEDFLISPGKLLDYKISGINRLSLGIQSLVDSELKFLTREHNAESALKVLDEALNVFGNVSTDIIYSLPGQTSDEIEITLGKIISSGARHVSAYTLIYEEETRLYSAYKKGIVKPNTDNDESVLYKYFTDKLTGNGYLHYEVSNYSREGFESKHNKKYWEYENYIGLGPSAHSFFYDKRRNNFRNIIKYNNILKENKLPVENEHILNHDDKKTEYIMLALRSSGIDFKKYSEILKEDFISSYKPLIEEMTENGFAGISETKFYLTEKGYAIADEITLKFIK